MRHSGWLLGLLLLLLGCTAPPDSGRLAYIGADGNVYVTDLRTTTQLTDDATAAAERNGRSYHRLSWSVDGWLALAAVEREGRTAQSELLALPPSLEGAPLRLGSSDSNFVIYNFWSPRPCGMGCQRLAYLIEEPEGVALRLVDVDEEAIGNERLAQGWPFYFSWSPEGEGMLWHRGGPAWTGENGRFQPGDFVQYDLFARQPVQTWQPGEFVAPVWLDGFRWVGVKAQNGQSVLTLFEARGEERPLLPPLDGEIAFVPSPDGTQLAYAIRQQPQDPFYSPIYLLDVATGETRQLTDNGFRIRAFFWSPDGERLGYLTWLRLRNDTLAQWRVLSLVEETDTGYAMFVPSPLMNFAIGSFNQFAQSHRWWSKDGRYLVYMAREEEMDSIHLIDTTLPNDAETLKIADGALAYWSFD